MFESRQADQISVPRRRDFGRRLRTFESTLDSCTGCQFHLVAACCQAVPIPRMTMLYKVFPALETTRSYRWLYLGIFVAGAFAWSFFGEGFVIDFKSGARYSELWASQAVIACVAGLATGWFMRSAPLGVPGLALWWGCALLPSVFVLHTAIWALCNPIRAGLGSLAFIASGARDVLYLIGGGFSVHLLGIGVGLLVVWLVRSRPRPC